MRKHRGANEGTIVQRKDGRWAAAISVGGRRRKWFYGSTREEVHRKLTAALHAANTTGLADARGLTVGEFLKQWLSEVAEPSIRPMTYRGYEVNVRLHINPVLGTIPLERLEPLHVQSLVNRKLKQALSPKTVRYIRGTLRTALNQAVRWGLVARNAAALVDGPRVASFEIQPFSPEEARRFLTAAKGHRLEALYSVALTMGLRQGEALGLRWQDIDLQMGYLRVARQLQRFDGVFQLVEPKTTRSRRTIVMPSTVLGVLAEHRGRQDLERDAAGPAWKEWGLVFTRPDGYPLDGTVVTHQFHRFLEQAGLPQRRFHDLRHSCATLLLAQGVSPRVVMEILGHSQIALTMNTYTHVVPDLRKDAAARMESLLNERER
ncbi:MAG: site-specific integrase [Chloroflexi bacterium]|nr:MAG: site-specific integrase [Chloroflexota bacterium]